MRPHATMPPRIPSRLLHRWLWLSGIIAVPFMTGLLRRARCRQSLPAAGGPAVTLYPQTKV
jgi:hypothetical protein